jgi:hypothetical protein
LSSVLTFIGFAIDLLFTPNQKHWSGTSGNMSALVEAGGKREAYVPVLLRWAFPAVIVVRSVRYYSGGAVHKAELLKQGKGRWQISAL